jgi:NADPH:quinone reductase-like Zn-dependent oxidoreductase
LRAALITELGRAPQVGEVPDPSGATIEVLAAPLNPVDRAVAAGQFYGGHPPLPYVPGCECVGREPTGRVVWTFGGGLGLARNGTMAERAEPGTVVAEVPDDADPALAAALGIAGLAGWMPIVSRAPVRPDDRVLVLGATGVAGQVALQAARLLGAESVVAAGRDREGLDRARALGADEAVHLDDDLGEPTYVFDPLCGEPLERAVAAAAAGARIVQLGQSAGPAATLPSAAIRGKQLEILGYSNFTTPPELLAEQYRRLVGHALAGAIRLEVDRVGLDDVASVWDRRGKVVVCP